MVLMTSGINFNPVARTANTINTSKKEVEEKINQGEQKNTSAIPKQDGWETKEKNDPAVTYSNIAKGKKASASEIESLKAQANQATENLRRLVEQLILKQSKGYKPAIDTENKEPILSQGTLSEIEQAQLDISEDGQWGVEAVSDRLVNFAISVSGGDKSKFAELVGAIDKGFAAAREAWGGKLPDISNKTYEATMQKLEAWANEAE